MSLPPNSTVAAESQARTSAPLCDLDRWFKSDVVPHETHLRNYLHGSFPAVRDVDDVIQESYLRLWKRRVLRPVESSKAYLFSIARNVCLDFLRRESRSPISAVTDISHVDALDQRPGVVDTAAAREEAILLAQAIHALPAKCREVVILRKIKGISQREIAQQLGLHEDTVQSQIYRGVKRIEAFLAERGVITTTVDDPAD